MWRGWANSLSPAHFSLCQLAISNSGSLEIILTIGGWLLGFPFDWTLIALQKPRNKCLMSFFFPTVGQGRVGGGFVFQMTEVLWMHAVAFLTNRTQRRGAGSPLRPPAASRTWKPESQRPLACWLSRLPDPLLSKAASLWEQASAPPACPPRGGTLSFLKYSSTLTSRASFWISFPCFGWSSEMLKCE